MPTRDSPPCFLSFAFSFTSSPSLAILHKDFSIFRFFADFLYKNFTTFFCFFFILHATSFSFSSLIFTFFCFFFFCCFLSVLFSLLPFMQILLYFHSHCNNYIFSSNFIPLIKYVRYSVSFFSFFFLY